MIHTVFASQKQLIIFIWPTKTRFDDVRISFIPQKIFIERNFEQLQHLQNDIIFSHFLCATVTHLPDLTAKLQINTKEKSVIVITFILVQSDPIKKRELYLVIVGI